MCSIFHPSRGGVRGGRDQFDWTSVKGDKDRECYLGHSVKASVGRWQEGKDIMWYTRQRSDALLESSEFREAKQLEDMALKNALGICLPDETNEEPAPNEDSPPRDMTFVQRCRQSDDWDVLLQYLLKRFGYKQLKSVLKTKRSSSESKHIGKRLKNDSGHDNVKNTDGFKERRHDSEDSSSEEEPTDVNRRCRRNDSPLSSSRSNSIEGRNYTGKKHGQKERRRQHSSSVEERRKDVKMHRKSKREDSISSPRNHRRSGSTYEETRKKEERRRRQYRRDSHSSSVERYNSKDKCRKNRRKNSPPSTERRSKRFDDRSGTHKRNGREDQRHHHSESDDSSSVEEINSKRRTTRHSPRDGRTSHVHKHSEKRSARSRSNARSPRSRSNARSPRRYSNERRNWETKKYRR